MNEEIIFDKPILTHSEIEFVRREYQNYIGSIVELENREYKSERNMNKKYTVEWNGLLKRDSIASDPIKRIKENAKKMGPIYRDVTMEDVEEAFRQLAIETNTTVEVPQARLVDTSRMSEIQIIEYLDTLSKQDEI